MPPFVSSDPEVVSPSNGSEIKSAAAGKKVVLGKLNFLLPALMHGNYVLLWRIWRRSYKFTRFLFYPGCGV